MNVTPNTPWPRRVGRSGLLLTMLLPVLGITFTSCGSDESREQSTPLAVATMRITPMPHTRDFTYAGTVEGRTRVTISTKLMGEVSSIPFA